MGPFDTSEAGNNYILMMIDQFTKWIEMAALPDQTALSVAHKFVTHFIVIFGCPMEVHVERYNTTVLQMIRFFIEKDNKNWDIDLPLLAMALHSTVHRQTGYTPNRLMLGREVIQLIHLITGNIPENW